MKVFACNGWIPRVKHGAGLLEFTPAKAGAGMTTKLKDPAGGWLHFLHKDSKEKQEMNKYSEFRNPHSAMGNSEFRIPKSAFQNWVSFRLFHSAIRIPQSAIGNRGFTLIEIIILIVMAGIILPTIIVPFVAGVKGSGKPEMATTAMFLAQQEMEEFMKFRYTNAALNPIALTVYADVDPANFPDYQSQWEIVYVDDNFNVVGDGIQATNHRGYKRILVRVKDPMNDTYEIYSVVTFFH